MYYWGSYQAVERFSLKCSGRKTADEVLSDFMTVWETHKRDQIVTIEEFEDYYKDLSASIDSDDYFELMIRNA